MHGEHEAARGGRGWACLVGGRLPRVGLTALVARDLHHSSHLMGALGSAVNRSSSPSLPRQLGIKQKKLSSG